MRRPFWFRAIIALWGVWFAAVLSETPGLRVCAVHAGHVGHAALDSHAAHGSTHSSTADDAVSTAPDHSQRAPETCTCLGACCCATPVAVVARVVRPLAVASPPTQAAIDATIAIPIVRRDRSQPFANGPPLA